MRKIKLYTQGIWYKLREKEIKYFYMSVLAGGIISYIRALSAGLIVNKHSIFEVFLWNMGNPVNLVFIHVLIYILIVSRFILFGSEDIYFMLHRESKRDIWLTNIMSVIIITIACVFGFLLTAALFSFNRGVFETNISYFLECNFGQAFVHGQSSVIETSMSLLGNVFAFYLSIGLSYFALLYISGKKNLALAVVFLLLALDYVFYLSRIKILEPYTFLSNVLPVYSETKMNGNIQFFYWGSVCGVLCVLTYLLTIYTSVLRGKRGGCNWVCKVAHTICYYKMKIFIYAIFLGVLYYSIASSYIGASGKTWKENIALYFAGSNQWDVRFLLWLFLEVVITLYVTNFIHISQNYHMSVRKLRLGSRINYAKYMMGIVISISISITVIVMGIVSILLWKCRSGLNFYSYMQLQNNGRYSFYLVNYVLGVVIYSLWVCVLNQCFRNLSKSYLIVLLIQMIGIMGYHAFSGIWQYFPLIQGYTCFFGIRFTCGFAILYQLIEIVVLTTIFCRNKSGLKVKDRRGQ